MEYLIILALLTISVFNVWAILNLMAYAGTVRWKLLWMAVILLLPVAGAVSFIILGPRRFASS